MGIKERDCFSQVVTGFTIQHPFAFSLIKFAKIQSDVVMVPIEGDVLIAVGPIRLNAEVCRPGLELKKAAVQVMEVTAGRIMQMAAQHDAAVQPVSADSLVRLPQPCQGVVEQKKTMGMDAVKKEEVCR